MKVTKKFSPKLVAGCAALLVVLASSAVVAINNQEHDSKTPYTATVQHNKIDTTEEAANTPDEIAAPETTSTVDTPTSAPIVSDTPKVLTTQEYAEEYLDLSKNIYQQCLDKIVSTWPERFTPEVREANVKALRVYASTCSTGIMQPEHRGIIFYYGPNGEFFDTPLADVGRNK